MLRKLNELIKRARLAKVHAYIVGHLREQMPSAWGKVKSCADRTRVWGYTYARNELESYEMHHQVRGGCVILSTIQHPYAPSQWKHELMHVTPKKRRRKTIPHTPKLWSLVVTLKDCDSLCFGTRIHLTRLIDAA